ncbi:hypothetical protein ACFQ2B_19485 [Streptomyces stramineus]
MKGAQSPLGARIALLALLLAPVLLLLPGRPAAAVTPAVTPAVTLDRTEAGKGGSITVSGSGWPERSLLTLLICGQNMIGGTNACANADGRTVTTGPDGAFRRKIPVAEPPSPARASSTWRRSRAARRPRTPPSGWPDTPSRRCLRRPAGSAWASSRCAWRATADC